MDETPIHLAALKSHLNCDKFDKIFSRIHQFELKTKCINIYSMLITFSKYYVIFSAKRLEGPKKTHIQGTWAQQSSFKGHFESQIEHLLVLS